MRNSLPLPANHPKDCMSAATKSYKYIRRLLKFNQMDFEFAFWQMLYLFIAPQKVYRNFQYRKTTKSQFARDDPAFLVLFAAWMCVTSIGFAVVFRFSFFQFIHFLLYLVFIDCILCGIIVATFFWFILNKYFRNTVHETDLEWGYAFDVHLNAYFPALILLHFTALVFYNGLIDHNWFVSILFGNTLWLIGCCYYIYITFLGYSTLQFLRRTETVFVWCSGVFLLYIGSLVGGYNIIHISMNYYRDRVV